MTTDFPTYRAVGEFTNFMTLTAGEAQADYFERKACRFMSEVAEVTF